MGNCKSLSLNVIVQHSKTEVCEYYFEALFMTFLSLFELAIDHTYSSFYSKWADANFKPMQSNTHKVVVTTLIHFTSSVTTSHHNFKSTHKVIIVNQFDKKVYIHLYVLLMFTCSILLLCFGCQEICILLHFSHVI